MSVFNIILFVLMLVWIIIVIIFFLYYNITKYKNFNFYNINFQYKRNSIFRKEIEVKSYDPVFLNFELKFKNKKIFKNYFSTSIFKNRDELLIYWASRSKDYYKYLISIVTNDNVKKYIDNELLKLKRKNKLYKIL